MLLWLYKVTRWKGCQVNVAKRVARDPLLDCRAGFSCCCDYKVARLKDCQVPLDYKGCKGSFTRFTCRLSCCCDNKVARSSVWLLDGQVTVTKRLLFRFSTDYQVARVFRGPDCWITNRLSERLKKAPVQDMYSVTLRDIYCIFTQRDVTLIILSRQEH